jgi:putative ABC transport system ATP-binding protein
MISAHPILKLAQIDRVYGTAASPLPVLRRIDLEVREGEFIAIVGPSGAGKTTLLNILGCLDRPSAGSYHLLGEDVAGLNDHRLSQVRKTRIGFIFQSFRLISHLSVLENVEMPLFYARVPRRRRRHRCMELITRVGLAHRAGHVPSKLSGGEGQRVAIARALANDPAVILADEPTGNLDSVTSGEIMELLLELHRAGRTIVLITHNQELAALVPRRVLLRDGEIVDDTGRERAADVPV